MIDILGILKVSVTLHIYLRGNHRNEAKNWNGKNALLRIVGAAVKDLVLMMLLGNFYSTVF